MKRMITFLISIMSLVIMAGVSTGAVSAQDGAVWTSKFYNNNYMGGSPTLQRQDSTVAFNWGTGSPGSGVNADNFSARFGTDVYLPEGNYRFYVLADDGVQLFVDFNNLIINTFDQP